MERLSKIVILTQLVDQLQQHGSWCGETHIQKAIYFLQELLNVPLGFENILYKRGPFSFDLRDELTALRADSMLELVVRPAPYGPSYKSTLSSKELRKHFPVTLVKYAGAIDFIASTLGTKDSSQLERLATALYVILNPECEQTDDDRAARIHLLKPHVTFQAAEKAIEEVRSIIKQTEQIKKAA